MGVGINILKIWSEHGLGSQRFNPEPCGISSTSSAQFYPSNKTNISFATLFTERHKFQKWRKKKTRCKYPQLSPTFSVIGVRLEWLRFDSALLWGQTPHELVGTEFLRRSAWKTSDPYKMCEIFEISLQLRIQFTLLANFQCNIESSVDRDMFTFSKSNYENVAHFSRSPSASETEVQLLKCTVSDQKLLVAPGATPNK